MKVAIIYYSMSGNVEYVAKKILEKMDADLIKLQPKNIYPDKGFKKFLWGGKSAMMKETPELENYEFEASKYDCIIIGSPVWAARITPPIRTFIKENKENIKDKKLAAYFCYSGAGAEKALADLRQLLDVQKFDSELIIVDPKDRNEAEKDNQIIDFCNKLI